MIGIDIDQLKSRISLIIIVIVGVVILVTIWGLVHERMQVIVAVERQIEGYVRALVEHVESAFAEADLVLLDILHDLRSYGGYERISQRGFYGLLQR